ncbi:ARL14 effector protein-like isoform X2 [Mya arenaria]|uniref:ARL14 effector protein-like isoform X2 n=1 Tax=Mya arenaria TaxID=6604 RepID=UPI0022E7FCD7|nr:ARL14 effector protein-like isoform X2 [Mya arenaria]
MSTSNFDDEVMIIDDDSDEDENLKNCSEEDYLSFARSRRESENARIQDQLEKLEKLDISEEEKQRQGKQLRMLAFVNPGKFMDDFVPEKSAREMKKINRRLNKDKVTKKNQLYDEFGNLAINGKNLCDCLDVDCPGCHFPCPKCSSEKCGGDCRCNRKWVYEYVESEGTGTTISWPPEART